jgi:hypothetical protein
MVRHQKGHKNSKGELAEWVIVSHKDGHIISSHKSKAEAEKHLGDIRKFKHMGESMDVVEAKELLENAGYRVLKEEELDEDFTMGVGELGADQGIPHSMQGCAVPMMRLGEPAPMGKIQKCCPPHPMHHHRPIPFGLWPVGIITTTSTKKRKHKKKKRKSKKKK